MIIPKLARNDVNWAHILINGKLDSSSNHFAYIMALQTTIGQDQDTIFTNYMNGKDMSDTFLQVIIGFADGDICVAFADYLTEEALYKLVELGNEERRINNSKGSD